MARATSRSFKLTTTLDVSSYSRIEQTSFAERLDAAVYEASDDYPAVTRYYVRHVPESSEIMIGLKIEKVSPDKVENIANMLVDQSIDSVFTGNSHTRPVAEESLLVRA